MDRTEVKKTEAPTLKTPRLVLRRRMEIDIPAMVMMFNTDDVRRYLGGYPPRDEHSMLRMVRHRHATEWAVTLRLVLGFDPEKSPCPDIAFML